MIDHYLRTFQALCLFKRCYLIPFAVFLFVTYSAQSQWVQTGGPEGGSTRDIVQSGNVLLVFVDQGSIFRSTDQGKTWSPGYDGLPCDKGVIALAEAQGVVYASVYEGGIYRSEDQGLTWVPANSGIENATFYTLYGYQDEVYAGGSGLYYSPDNGNTWYDRTGGVSGEYIRDFLVYNSRVYAAGQKLYESSDNGVTWRMIDLPNVPVSGIDALTLNGNTVVAAGIRKIYVSSDQFNSFTEVSLAANNSTAQNLVVFNNKIYLCSGKGRYFVSEDNGLTWLENRINSIDYLTIDLHFISGGMLMSTGHGIYRSADNGTNWSKSNTGLLGFMIPEMMHSGGLVYAGTLSQGVFRSGNGGMSWEEVNSGLDVLGSKGIRGLVTNGTRIFLATEGGLYTSDDQGITWTRRYDPGLNRSVAAIAIDNGRVVAGIPEAGVIFSDDGGNTWRLLPVSGLNIQMDYKALFFQGDVIVISGNDGVLYRSENLGNTWSKVFVGNNNYNFVYEFSFDNGELYAATTRGIYVSRDSGISWTQFGNSQKAFFAVVAEGDFVYAGAFDGVYVASKTEKIWYNLCVGMGSTGVVSLVSDGSSLYAGTYGRSVWKRDLVAGTLPPKEGADTEISALSVCPAEGLVDLYMAAGISRDRKGTWSPALADPNGMFDPAVDLPGLYTFSFEGAVCGCPEYRKVKVDLKGTTLAGKDMETSFCKSDPPVHLLELIGVTADPGGVWNPGLDSGTDLFDPAKDLEGVYTYSIPVDGCIASSVTFTIGLRELPYAGENGSADICVNDPRFDLFNALGGTPDAGGTWLPALSSGSSVFDPLTDPPGIYTYFVDNGSCSDFAEVSVQLSKLPENLSTDHISVCRNGGAVDLLEAMGGNMQDNGYWTPDLPNNLFDPLIHSSGKYTYTTANSCGTSSVGVEVVVGDAYPYEDFQVRVEEFANRNRLTVTVGSGTAFEYSLDGVHFQESGVFEVMEGGIYQITGREKDGCGIFKKEILILDYPRFFTPNGDGIHDTWGIEGLISGDFLLFIYDRYGKMLKQLNTSNPSWDGTYRGAPMPVNDYWFRLELQDGRIQKGHFSLKR